MTTHETLVHSDDVVPGSDRGFGLVVGGILSIIGGYLYYTDSSLALYLLPPGILLFTIGLIYPSILHPLNVLWTKLGLLLGRIVTPIVMFIVFAVTVVPIGILLRVFGKDLLRLKKNTGGHSYWIERSPPGPSPDSLNEQF